MLRFQSSALDLLGVARFFQSERASDRRASLTDQQRRPGRSQASRITLEAHHERALELSLVAPLGPGAMMSVLHRATV
jgi:hypothetical protein